MIHLDTNYLIGLLVKGSPQAGDVFSAGAKERHDAVAAEQVLARGMKALELNEAQLVQLAKGAAEKVALAWWLRQRTTVRLRWVSERLHMGHY